MKKFFVLFSLICLAVFALAGCTPSDQTVSRNGNNNGLFHYYTVGKNTKAIKEYISTQLEKDRQGDQLSIFDPRDPFTGSK